MTIDEAIRELAGVLVDMCDPKSLQHKAASGLGIEALKVYKKSQEAGWYPPGYKLPGETED